MPLPTPSIDLPEEREERARPWAGLAGSVVFHTILVLAIVLAFRHRAEPAAEPAPAQTVAQPATQMVYLPPAPRPPPVVRTPVPQTAPPPPEVHRVPPAPEHDQPEGTPTPTPTPRPAAPSPADPAPSTPRPSTPDVAAAPAPAPAAVTMESEARRLFGKRRGGSATAGPIQQPGLPIYIPEQEGACRPTEKPPRDPDTPPELATVKGRVYSQAGLPLPGALLQVIGTGYNALSDDGGFYVLRFDKSLVDNCRSQIVRVSAPGYKAQNLVLSLGPSAANDISLPRR